MSDSDEKTDSARQPGKMGHAQCPHCKQSISTSPSGHMVPHSHDRGMCEGSGKAAR